MSDYNRFVERARKRRELAASLAAQGKSFVEIARKLRISPQRAGQLVKAELSRAAQ